MAPDFDDRQSHQDQDTATEREALVDINTGPASSGETGIQLKPRRKRLSNAEGRTEDPQPEPKPQRRSLSDVAQTHVDVPIPESRPSSGRPRLSISQTPVAVMEAPEDTAVSQIQGDAPASPDAVEVTRAGSQPDPVRIEQWITELHAKQNLPLAAAGGLLAALVGAMLWAVMTVTTSYQIGWMAVGVGFLVGGVTRTLGRGLDKSFGYLGAVLALLGCLLGNHLTNCMLIARETGLSATAVLTRLHPAAVLRLMTATFHPLDVLFYGLAVYAGYRFSFRRMSNAEVAAVAHNG